MSQIFILTGENLYQIAEEKKRWIDGFVEKFGEENLTKLEVKSLKMTDILDAVTAAPFIAEKRLVVLDGIPKIDKEQVQSLAGSMHPATLLLIVEPKPDKRLSATKELLSTADVKTFGVLKGTQLSQWLQGTIKQYGADIATKEVQYLIHHVGEDQMLLASEAQKIATYAMGRAIMKDDIDLLTMLSTEQAGWKLMDLIAAGKVNEALAFASRLMSRGESPYALWSRMIWVVTQLAAVSACVDGGTTNPANIAKEAGVPFPTARTLLPYAKKLDQKSLHDILHQFTEADIAMKTGGYRSTVDATDEITALVDSCISRLCTT